jgi:hypothetical protein
MEVLWGLTLWLLAACWLVCQHLDAPPPFRRAAAVLLAFELGALAVHSYGCTGRCSAAANAAQSLATVDVPALAGVLLGVAGVHAWRRAA